MKAVGTGFKLTPTPTPKPSEMGRREKEKGGGGGKEKRWGREVVEHCSADKLMQQSWLSQQHTPSLAWCLHQLRGCLGNRLPRLEKPAKLTTFLPIFSLVNDTFER